MPIYEYRAIKDGCEKCSKCLEVMQKMKAPHLETCPHCGAALKKLVSCPAKPIADIMSDSNCKAKGFHKLVKKDKGVYEKVY